MAWKSFAATAPASAIGCEALILACNGYGGNPDLVRRYIPEMANALYFGHPGNRGDAIQWGEALGAQPAHLGAYQGHGSVATPHNILITWAAIMQGGFQVNSEGRRFCDELHGLFRTGGRGASPAGRHRLERIRRAHRRGGAAVRGFSAMPSEAVRS